MLFGHEEYMFSAFLHGAEGAVGATFNFDFLMPIYKQIFDIGSGKVPMSQDSIQEVQMDRIHSLNMLAVLDLTLNGVMRFPVQGIKQQQRAHDAIAVLIKHGFIPSIKAIMTAQGHKAGTPRLPMKPLTDTQFAALKADLERFGFKL
jgi:dihydrodipicolinate synthase/N-acetylneuraminate lyase